MIMSKIYVLEYFVSYFVWPLTVFCLLILGISTLISYIVYKLQNDKNKNSFKRLFKKWSKFASFIYLGIIIFNVLFILLASPNDSYHFLDHIYWQVDSLMRNVESWIMHNSTFMTFIMGGLMSLFFLAFLFQKYDVKMGIKAFVIYLIVSIPLISGLLYLTTQISLITIIILIGLPGALISYLKK